MSPDVTCCRYPEDHEIHDQDRARYAGWRYHAYGSKSDMIPAGLRGEWLVERKHSG